MHGLPSRPRAQEQELNQRSAGVPAGRSLLLIPVIGWALWVGLWAHTEARREATAAYYGDFGRFYYSTQQFVARLPMYEPVPASLRTPENVLRQRTDLNPPHAHLLWLPLVGFSISTALAVWRAMGWLLLGWSAWITARALKMKPQPFERWLIGFAVLTNVGVLAWWSNGQITMAMLPPMTLGWLAARRERWTQAGAWMGLCWSLKPFLGLFALYFILIKRWSALTAGIVTSGLAFGIGLIVFGLDAHLGWLADLSLVTWAISPANASMLGLTSRWWPAFATLAWIVGGLFIALLTAWRVQRPSVDQAWLAVLIAALLISPLGWIYYVPWILGPLAAVWIQTRDPRLPWTAAPLWVPWVFLPQYYGLIGGTLGSLYTWSLLGIWAVVLHSAHVARAALADSPHGRLRRAAHLL